MTDLEFGKIIELITNMTGIIPRESHKSGIRKFVEKKVETMTFQEYFNLIQADRNEFYQFVNGTTVNETYFFREEKQFELLKKKIFPEWIKRNGAKPIKIWSAACSEGEEAYSLLLLAESCRIKSEITASDINTEVLEKCIKGIYKNASIRVGDGEIFLPLVEPYKEDDGEIKFPEKIKNSISTMRVNLSKIDTEIFPVARQDLIFIRNVFIYFSRETKARILKTLADKYLNDNGVIFVSINEIAQLDSEIVPESLEKISDGNVFYFRKKEKK